MQLPSHPSRYLRSLRPSKPIHLPDRLQGWQIESEPWIDRNAGGQIDSKTCSTFFLTGAECKFTCAMCDLWQYTIDGSTAEGHLPMQIAQAIDEMARQGVQADWVKLYNASNFFDETSVPQVDLPTIARLCQPFERVVVENHPRMFATTSTQKRCLEFRDRLVNPLEVAMGLETIDPSAMQLMNKEMTLAAFESACRFLRSNEIAIRSFVLLQPPGTDATRSVDEAVKACEFAWGHGVRHVSIVPTRLGKGWLQKMYDQGEWRPPNASQLLEALTRCLERRSAYDEASIATADLWDWPQLPKESHEAQAMLNQLEQMNRSQTNDSALWTA